jgi:hypothetical protein
MIGRGELERVLTLRVRTIDGETEHVPVRLRVGAEGAVLRVFAPPLPQPPAPSPTVAATPETVRL